MWVSKVSWGSILTPRLVTDVDVLTREGDTGDGGRAELMWCANEDGFCF